MTTDRAQLLDEAAEWHLRLQDGQVSDDTIARWVQWCESDVRKQRAFDEVREFWQATAALAPEIRNGDLVDAPRAVQIKSRSWFFRWPAVTGYAVAAAAIAWVMVSPVLKGWQPDDGIMRLPDGSRVEVAAGTQLDVRYTDEARALDLKSGAAYFTVAPDKDQPFTVTVGDLKVRALGTAFNIRRAATRTVLTVTDGRVEVTGQGASTQATAGQQLTFDSGEPAPRIAPANTYAALAWREGRLEYIREPLDAVIADLNRYTEHPVVIADAAAKALHFSGTVLTASTAEWIAALPGILPLTVQNENGVDVIRSRP